MLNGDSYNRSLNSLSSVVDLDDQSAQSCSGGYSIQLFNDDLDLVKTVDITEKEGLDRANYGLNDTAFHAFRIVDTPEIGSTYYLSTKSTDGGSLERKGLKANTMYGFSDISDKKSSFSVDKWTR